jgi:hypothetical protein
VPLIVFDECHKAKNLLTSRGSTSKTALAVVAIQEAIPEARVLYCSATGAAAMQNLGTRPTPCATARRFKPTPELKRRELAPPCSATGTSTLTS